MFGFFRKQPPAAPPVVEKRDGILTSDEDMPLVPQYGRLQFDARVKQAHALSPMHAPEFAQDAACGSNLKSGYQMMREEGHLSDVLLHWFTSQTFIGHQLCAYIAQHWLVAKACFMPGRDAVRQGFTITSDDGSDLDPKVLQAFQKADERYRLNDMLIDFVGMGRVYGVRLCLFKVKYANPREAYEAPFNPDGVTANTYEGMVLIDPYWASPIMDTAGASDPTSPHFYEPTWWMVNGQKYHRSHFCIFRNGHVADILKPVYLYGGVPLPQQIAERVYCAERTANEAPQLAMTKRSTILQVDATAFMAGGEKSLDKIRNWRAYLDNYAVKIIDKEGEGIEQFDTSLADLDAVIMSQFQLVAAEAGVPVTKLMGTTPKGFNATGEYDEKNYHEELESLQTLKLSPVVERHHDLVMRSSIAPKLLDGKFISTTTVWAPLDSPSAKEAADAQLAQAQRDAALVTAGAIDGFDVRERLRRDRESGFYGISEAAPEAPVEAVTVAEPGVPVPVGDAAINPMQIVSNQTFLDPAVVQRKLLERDFDVQVSPCFVDEAGVRYRIVIDGHHSLAAAQKAGVEPNFIEGDYRGSDYVVLTDA